MNRLQTRQRQGRRELVAIILLVVPLVALGYYLAVIEVAVDPPPDPASASTPTVVTSPVPPQEGAPSTPATPPPPVATPAPGASGIAPAAQDDAIATLSSPLPVPWL